MSFLFIFPNPFPRIHHPDWLAPSSKLLLSCKRSLFEVSCRNNIKASMRSRLRLGVDESASTPLVLTLVLCVCFCRLELSSRSDIGTVSDLTVRHFQNATVTELMSHKKMTLPSREENEERSN
jgi:hypothetical protein